ncbi:hypothetical protein C5167_038061 [Papaver somniferum]|uniref:Uncharacterized protein n=1 Tax=Papaver somniferum TaxID=3469 RepID=A0A4Y7ICH1_PAPSO|nr:hypothetical protein C5167_038061 [Papaver somniferum]
MADNNENQSLEGGNGQHIESSNLDILMKSMAEMRQHQLLLEERLGILHPRHNSGSAARQGPAKRPMFSAPNQTFGRPPVRPWTTGSTSAPPATRPPSVRPQGRWIRFQQVRPDAPTSSGTNSFQCHGGECGHFKRDYQKNPPTGLTQQGEIYAMEPVMTTNQEESEESQVLYTLVEGVDSATDQVVENTNQVMLDRRGGGVDAVNT